MCLQKATLWIPMLIEGRDKWKLVLIREALLPSKTIAVALQRAVYLTAFLPL